MFGKVKCMLQWQQVVYSERVDSQWQKVNRGIPRWQKVEYWDPIRIMLKGRWDIGWFKNPQGVLPLPNQANLFLRLRVIYVFVFIFFFIHVYFSKTIKQYIN